MSVVPALELTRPSKICRETRKVSPSLAIAGSSITGSDEAAKRKVSLAAEPLASLPASRWLWAQEASAVTVATEASTAIDFFSERAMDKVHLRCAAPPPEPQYQ